MKNFTKRRMIHKQEIQDVAPPNPENNDKKRNPGKPGRPKNNVWNFS